MTMSSFESLQGAFGASSTIKLLFGIGIPLLCCMIIAIGVYRLFISPFSQFPGPKFPALTSWYETWFQLFKGDGGQFFFEVHRWHEKYGPVVRIGPNEVHIQDSDFFDVLYSQSRHADKLASLAHRFNSPDSAFSTVEHHVHRKRRGALNPFFSKQKIFNRSSGIQAHMDRLCKHIMDSFSGSRRILTLNEMWGCWTCDIIIEYCFEKNFGFIDREDLQSPFTTSMIDLLEPVHFVTSFPSVMAVLTSLPDSIIKFLQPNMTSVIDFNNEMTSQIHKVMRSRNIDREKRQTRDTVFNALLESDLPPDEISVRRLQHEAISVVGAGIETTMRALSVASFHILDNPSVHRQLKEELEKAIPDASESLSWYELEKLPYLSACIQEALRLSYGTAQRAPRTHSKPVEYGSFVIPPGGVVSMDSYAVSHDEQIFPDSFAFRPERWLDNAKAPNGKPLTRYMTAFGKGTRSCVGFQLAYAEMYIGLASLFRRFDMELYDTRRDAVDVWMDRFVPRPRPGTQGVRVRVG